MDASTNAELHSPNLTAALRRRGSSGEIAHGQFFMNGGGTLLSQGGLLKGFELGK